MGCFVVVSNVAEVLAWFVIVPTIAYAARRMHDVGKSAWWLLFWPVALFFALRPSASGLVTSPTASSGSDWISARVTDAQSLAKTVMSKFEAVRGVLKGSTGLTGSTSIESPAIPSTPAKPTRSDSPDVSAGPGRASEPPRIAKRSGPSDAEIFVTTAASLGIVTTSDESVVALAQSLLRRTWSQVRSQQETDPSHTDHFRLAIRALADYATGKGGHPVTDPIETAKTWLWYGILLALVTTDDHAPSTLGSAARFSASDALREARRLFESKNDRKMAGRCMEELGQLGRLLGRSDLVTEGFDAAVNLFQSAEAADRAKQATTNAGTNFQRHSSAFFDGGQHSLKATTILGSIQGERLRSVLHHLD